MNDEKVWYKSWPKGVKKNLEYPEIELHKLFEKTVHRNYNRTYLSLMGIEWTFGEINDTADRIAAALKDLGIIKGDHIGIFMPNIPQFVMAFFGILKAGAVVVPISPIYGNEDLAQAVKNSKIKAIFALDFLYENIQNALAEDEQPKIKILTSLGDLLSPIKRFLAKLIRKIPPAPDVPDAIGLYDLIEKYEPLKNSMDCDPKTDVAVIGYTGGTTGTPKGAMLTHHNLVSNLIQAREWSAVAHPDDSHKGFVGAVPFFHIIGLTAVMLVAFYYESTVYLVPNPREFESILKLIEKNQISYFHGVPTLFRALLNLPKFDKYDLTSLEIVFSGAAPLPDDIANKMEQKTGCMMIEAYGMTETSPMVAANPFERDNRKLGSIGIPFPDTDFKIISLESDEEVTHGENGEVVIKGPQVMKGYWKKPTETAETLMDGWIHTGDIGYMDEDGFVFLVNRKKDMINVSGYKVFPKEIEGTLITEFSQIDELAIVGTPDDYSGEAVKLFLSLSPNESLSEAEIIAFFEQRFAKYKRPKYIEFLDELPKTGVGKVDRKRLREM